MCWFSNCLYQLLLIVQYSDDKMNLMSDVSMQNQLFSLILRVVVLSVVTNMTRASLIRASQYNLYLTAFE